MVSGQRVSVILALGVAAVGLLASCGSDAPAVGRATVEFTIAPANSCPAITSTVVSPATASVGASVVAAATAADADPGDTLTFSWSPAAAFTNPSAATTAFTCPSRGPQTLTLSVSDNHQPTACATSVSLAVTCR